MSDDLLQLWAKRDATAQPDEDQVLLVYKQGDEPDAIRPTARPVSPDAVSEDVQIVSETIPIPNVTLFPTVKIALPSVNLAAYHVPKR